MNQRYVSFLLLLLLFFQALPFTARTPAASPVSNKTSPVAGLRASVTIRRDERGIPHITAANEDDLYFAQGYVTAQDRLWQMDLLRRTARGELAEIFGQAVLEDDKRRRTYGFTRIAAASLATATPPVRAALEAYARGVNAYIASLDGSAGKKLPLEFLILQYQPRAWTPIDSLALAKNFDEVLSTTWPTDLLRALLADLPAEQREFLLPSSSALDVIVVGNDRAPQKKSAVQMPAALPQSKTVRDAIGRELANVLAAQERARALFGYAVPGMNASNNWVLSGQRTVSGKPLLANDPHLAPSAPSIWHMVHLQAPGLNVAGVTAAGSPGVIIGHNEQIAWGLTNLGPDVQDLYLEKFTGAGGRTYLTPTGPREAEVRQEEIKVRKSPTDPSTNSVMHEVTVTRHGPVILDRAGARYALRWTALDASGNAMEGFYKLNRARDWNEFCAALREYRGATQNFVYADTKGHIGYYGAGLIPIRKSGDGSTPYDGATDAGEWTSFIPFERLPHSYDPPSGMIVTANSRVAGFDYPHHLTHNWAAPYRARRIYELLQATPKHTADTFRRIQGDTYSIFGKTFADHVLAIGRSITAEREDKIVGAGLVPARSLRHSRAGTSPAPTSFFTVKSVNQVDALEQFRQSSKQIAAWDGNLNPDSPVGPLMAEMENAFRQRILTAALGPERARQYAWDAHYLWMNQLLTARPAAWLPKEFKNYGELILACYADARAALTKRIGADEAQWTWGRYTQARFPHPLAIVPFIGQQFLIPPFPESGTGGRPGATVNVGDGVSMRFIADLSNWDHTQQGIALGESGDPQSKHWSDQLSDWRAVTPRALPFNSTAVAAAAREMLIMMPAK